MSNKRILVQVLAVVLLCTFVQYSDAKPSVCPRRHCNCLSICKYGKQWWNKFCPECDCFNLCPYIRCPKGKRCRQNVIYCIMAPCPAPTYECVPDVECGTVCANYCPYGRKFENNCPTCECELTPCATMRCRAGYECQATEVGDCTEAPCPRSTAQCVPTATGPTTAGCPQICTMEYLPVCGSDGKMYGNRCQLDVAICESGGALQEGTGCEEGPTTPDCPDVCTLQYDPVCGTDGKTYGNECQLNIASCESGRAFQFSHAGACEEGPTTPDCPTACTLEYAPVCGNNGQTYSNRCELDVANCESGGSIQYAGDGICFLTTPGYEY